MANQGSKANTIIYMPKIEKAQMRERMKKVGRNGKKKYQVLMEV